MVMNSNWARNQEFLLVGRPAAMHCLSSEGNYVSIWKEVAVFDFRHIICEEKTSRNLIYCVL
jgi:hypothetical protein